MKEFFLFLKSKRFRIHLIISIIAVAVVLWMSFKFLNMYTNHGEMVTVPDFIGLSTNVETQNFVSLDKFIADKNLRYQIIDSVFDAKVEPGTILRQDPENNSQVKYNRIVYLTVGAKLPPLVKMPNLVDASVRQAMAMLESYGLKAGKKEYRSDPCVNCVLAQTMKGKKIETGTMIPKGSVIDLVLGKGESDEKMNVPCLLGLSKADAIEKITENGFSEGAIVCSDCKTDTDSEKAKVYKQSPVCSDENLTNPGSSIDIYLSVKIIVVPSDTTGKR